MPYDPKKAETFNKLRQQGLSEDAAADQAGITDADFGNYAIGSNGQMGAVVNGTSKVAGVDFDRPTAAEQVESARFEQGLQSSSNFETVSYPQKASAPPSSVTPTTYTTTSTETVSGGGSTAITAGPRVPTTQSQALQPAIDAKQAQIDQFIKDNPSDFARKKQGLPPLTPEEKQQRQQTLDSLTAESAALKNQQIDAASPGTPTVTTTPNTTTTTQTVTTATASTNQAVNPETDQKLSQENEIQLDATVSPANGDTVRSAPPVSAAPPPQEAINGLDVEPVASDINGLDLPAPQEPINGLDVEPVASDINGLDLPPPQEAINGLDIEPVASDINGLDLPPPQEAINGLDLPAPVASDINGLDLPPPQEAINGLDIEPVASDINGLDLPPPQEPINGLDLPAPVDVEGDEALAATERAQREQAAALPNFDAVNPDEAAAAEEKAAKFNTTQQATLQARYKQPGNQDWRVRISLSAGAKYLYNDPEPGILAPLVKTDGVVFPYTPSIETSYAANYAKYDLTHSNYRGVFFQNSAVNDINIRGMFTAQDTSEAEYMLAVIQFFRSATKMFYGKDSQRGAPPPLVYLTGYGDYQFAGHPCVITNFSYSLPSDVDYIRANNPNNYGTDLLNRRSAALSSPTAFNGADARKSLLAALGIPPGATPSKPTPGPITNSVTNTARATYVPTKIEINVTLLPVQTRDQVSKQFSLKDFANGKLIQGGFW